MVWEAPACATTVAGSRRRNLKASTRFSLSTKFPNKKWLAGISFTPFFVPRLSSLRIDSRRPRMFRCFWRMDLFGGYNGRMRNRQESSPMHGTTVLCVRKDNKVVLIADGQVTMGDHVMKHTARKTRRLYNDKVVAGFAGSTADAITLFERFEGKLQEFSG